MRAQIALTLTALQDKARKQQLRAQLLVNDVLMMSSPALKNTLEECRAKGAHAHARDVHTLSRDDVACVLTWRLGVLRAQ